MAPIFVRAAARFRTFHQSTTCSDNRAFARGRTQHGYGEGGVYTNSGDGDGKVRIPVPEPRSCAGELARRESIDPLENIIIEGSARV